MENTDNRIDAYLEYQIKLKDITERWKTVVKGKDEIIDRYEAKFNNVDLSDVSISAYLVGNGDKQLIVFAKNMADACDKLDANGYKGDYSFTKFGSIDVLH